MIHEMKLRRISSLWTPIHKFVLPVTFLLWSIYILIFDMGMRIDPDLWWFYTAPLLIEAILFWHAIRLMWVALDETNGVLYVSNYRREIAIPLSHIANVTESYWTDPRRIKITLDKPSEFGDKIVFLGTYRVGGILAGPHPIVNELQTLAAKARESSVRFHHFDPDRCREASR